MMPRSMSRRVLLTDLGRMTVGAVVLGFSGACQSTGTDGDAETSTPTRPDGTGSLADGPTTTATGDPVAGLSWHRVDLDFVSAYVLVRDGEAVVIDTGVEGSADLIETTLTEAGVSWDAVGHVILTHKHPDHVGSLDAVLARATGATAHAGAADIPNIETSHDVAAVGDGDRIFDLTIVATPGHTPGHVSVHDPTAGLMVAGDALNGSDGGVTAANPDFSEDMAAADESVRKLAGLVFDTVVFGHGDPVEVDADAKVAELAATL